MRWFIVLALITVGLSFGIYAQSDSSLPILYDAPELHDGIWLNTETPYRLENLRGNVVLLEMWTFDCINCIRTLPNIQEWHEAYADEGLIVIGNHYPEFQYEHDLANLRSTITQYEITYPILQDNDRETWGAYNNRYWPTIYLIDKQGQVRYVHIGEGRYDSTETVIQMLLDEPYETVEPEDIDTANIHSLTATEALNVRRGASIQFERIGLIMPNEAYYILDEVDGWYQILFDGATAYVSGDYVIVSGEPES